MDSNTFKTKIEVCHRVWLANTLEMKFDGRNGLDLNDEVIGIELKSRMQRWGRSWTVHDYQVQEFRSQNPETDLYWAFLLYNISKQPKSINSRRKNLEPLVSNREIWFLPWNWIRQFPTSSPPTGPYIYVKGKSFPNGTYFTDIDYNGAQFHVPKDSILEQVLINRIFTECSEIDQYKAL